MNYNETIYSSSHMIGVEEVGPYVREITLLALMNECGAFSEWDRAHLIDRIQDLAIVWHHDGEDVEIDYIYDHSTGEVYWENKINEEDYEWTDGDEKLLCSLLMWADVESTIA